MDPKFAPTGTILQDIPAHQTSVYCIGNIYHLEGLLNKNVIPLSPHQNSRMHRLIPDLIYLVNNLVISWRIEGKLIYDIIAGTASAVSSGSFKDGYNTSAGINHRYNKSEHMIFDNLVPRLISHQSSSQSKLAGIIKILHIIQALT